MMTITALYQERACYTCPFLHFSFAFASQARSSPSPLVPLLNCLNTIQQHAWLFTITASWLPTSHKICMMKQQKEKRRHSSKARRRPKNCWDASCYPRCSRQQRQQLCVTHYTFRKATEYFCIVENLIKSPAVVFSACSAIYRLERGLENYTVLCGALPITWILN